VGQPATGKLHLRVLYGPVVGVGEGAVQGGSGKSLTLHCQVSGDPKPHVVWHKDDKQLTDLNHAGSDNRLRIESGKTISLTIPRSDSSSFGNYTCTATNSVGTDSGSIDVHGRPSAPTFIGTSPAGMLSRSILWRTTSYFPIQEYRLLYKQVDKPEWKSVRVPGDGNKRRKEKGIYESEWTLVDLDTDKKFESIIQASNEYGWGDPSNIFTFNTLQESPSRSILGQQFYGSSGQEPAFTIQNLLSAILISLLL